MTKNIDKEKCVCLSQLRIQTEKFYLRIQLLLKDKMRLMMKNYFGGSLKDQIFNVERVQTLINEHSTMQPNWPFK